MTKAIAVAVEVAARAQGARLRAVDYLRVSTEEQKKGYGIAYTGKRTARYIEKKAWDHVGTYADEGFSGSLEAHERDDLKRLMEDARKIPRPFDMVVVPEARAIGRAGRAFWPWVWELEDLGVYVAVVKKDYDNSCADGRSRMRKDADAAEDEREAIRDRTQGGIQEKAEDGGFTGGKRRYGYRIANKGMTGESRLVPDVCDGAEACIYEAGECRTIHEAPVLRRARELVIKYQGVFRKAALALNAEGLVTRSGKPWTHQNLRSRLLGEDLLQARVVFRKAGRSAYTADGTPVYGDSTVIDLSPIFTPEEVDDLRKAVARPARSSAAASGVYPLSGRIRSLCGSHYIGQARRAGEVRAYRCKGKTEKYAGAKVCGCSQINAGAVEKWAWKGVRELLGDAERLKMMADERVELTSGQRVNFTDRLADLNRQIEEQDEAMDVTMAVAAKQAAKKGLRGREAEKAVSRALKPLEEELSHLQEMRAEVAAWQAEAEEARGRATDLQRLAELAHHNLETFTAEQQARFLGLLNITVTLKSAPPGAREGSPCSLVKWFRDRARPVPVLTDAGWAKVEDLMIVQFRTLQPRQLLAGLLYKARTDCRWPELPAEYGAHGSVKTYWRRWEQSGLWDQIMERLKDEDGAPVPAPSLLPMMDLAGEIRPGELLASNWDAGTPQPSESCSKVSVRFRLSLAA